MNKQIKSFYRRSRQFFMESILSVKELDNSISAVADVCDAVYMLREVDDYINKLRKELDKLSQTYKAAACLHITTMHRKSFKTEYCTATKDSKTSRGLPSKSGKPEEYRELLEFLGVPDEIIKAGILSCHWPNFNEWLTERMKEGKPRPPGLGDPSPIFGLKIRARKDILDESDSTTPEVVN